MDVPFAKEFTDAVEQRLAGQDQSLAEVKAVLLDVQQKMVRPRGGVHMEADSWGAQVARHHDLRTFAGETTRPARLKIELKTTITSAAGSGGDLVVPHRDGIVMMPQRAPRVRDLLPVIQVESGSVEYASQSIRTNNAAIQTSEGAAKQKSALAFELKTSPIRTIAHWIPASRQVLDDAPQLRGIIDNELLYGLAYVEETQLLNGAGTGVNLTGLTVGATAFSPPITLPGPVTKLDVLGLAILQTGNADFVPDGIVLHPSDWMSIRLQKDTGGAYILGDPATSTEQRLWGLPVVTTTAMAVGKFLVGQFSAAATLYDRMAPTIMLSTEHDDFFTRNLVAILAEERIGLAIKQATALTYGDFAAAITASTAE